MRAGVAAAPEHDGEDVRDLEQQACERPVRVLRKRPEQPTAAEVQVHEISGHEPYRSWCRACVAGRGRADAMGGDLGLRTVFRSFDLTTATCGVEHQKRQMRQMTRSQARIRQCFVEGAVWIGGSLVIFVGQKVTTSGIVQFCQKSCKLEATPRWLCVVMVSLRCWHT